MFGNIGTALGSNLRPANGGAALGVTAAGGLSPNSTGTNTQASSNPAGGYFNFGNQRQQPTGAVSMPGNGAAMHASGLPKQPPSGINPQLWSSVLQHLQQTNFGKQQTQMQTQPINMNQRTGAAFVGAQ
jgi:hypothetical protein